jgi:hypothetical protein
MEWLPADTAPRDGTPVLGFWAPANKLQTVDERNYALTYFEAGEWRSIGHWDETYADPTNWMPLPPPPLPKEPA